jgi:lysozyme
MRPIPEAAVSLVKQFEGCQLTSYKCPAGIWTVGYGQTGPDVVGGVTWTQEQADERLKASLEKFADAVDGLVKVPLTDNQRAALISFAYNVGSGALWRSTLLRKLNEGKPREAAEQFLVWNKAGGKVLPGLSRRRVAERKLFLTQD